LNGCSAPASITIVVPVTYRDSSQVACVHGDDVSALLGQAQRVRTALAACRTGDEGDLAFDSSHG
jgi:hypothetical protein